VSVKLKYPNWIAAGLLAVVLVAYTWAQWHYFTARVPGGNDFMCHYGLWRACFRDHLNPYSDAAVLQTQLAIYGRPAHPGEDLNRLVYPVYSIVVYGPFILFEYTLARAMFMTVLQVGLFAGVALTLRLLRWKPPLWMLMLVFGWALLNYHEARAVLLGQVAVLAYGWFAGLLYALEHKRDVLAGLLMVLLTVKPTLIFLLIPFLLLWAARRRRWRFLVAFFGGVGALSLIGLLFWPTWIQDWLRRMTDYGDYVRAFGLLHQLAPNAAIEYALMAAALAWIGWTWWQALRPAAANAETLWAIGVTTWTTNVIVARAASPNYVLMLLPTLWIFTVLDRRGGRAGRWIAALIMLAMLVGHWWLHFATVVGNVEQAGVFVPWPLALGAVLLVSRKWLMTDAAQAGMAL
jgi:hypothetical protein